MNTKTLKALTVAVSLLGGMGAASPAMATQTGLQFLAGGPQNSTDAWTFTCPLFFPRARGTVEDAPPILLGQLQLVLGQSGPWSQVQDGDGGGISPVAVVNGVAGVPYVAVFKKTAANIEWYRGDLWCTNIVGVVKFNPIITRRINQ